MDSVGPDILTKQYGNKFSKRNLANFHCLGQHIYALDDLPNKVLASEYKIT